MSTKDLPYCTNVWRCKRFKTREVLVGKVGIGGSNPLRIQSMTTSNTRDVQATIDQTKRLADEGCEIVRVTVQGIKEAEACEEIKNGLIQSGYNIPIVADIHFFPRAAIQVVDFVDKVRINPGNFADTRATFKELDLSEDIFVSHLKKIEEKFAPLIIKCKKQGKSIRIGTNHGSLSDRMMTRFGDTPQGMVQSAIEYAEICRKYEFHDIVFSMKSSNTRVMVHAYRLLVAEMIKRGWDYPLHLGVTEAGEGEDGRVKSSVGIGALLADGIGDTIRVSLTEDPWYEIKPCFQLRSFGENMEGQGVEKYEESTRNPYAFERRKVVTPNESPFHRDGTVMVDGDAENPGVSLTPLKDLIHTTSTRNRFSHSLTFHSTMCNILITDESEEEWKALLSYKPRAIFLNPLKNRIHQCRKFFDWMRRNDFSCPVLFHFSYSCSEEDLIVQASCEAGALFSDGLGEGLYLHGPYDPKKLVSLSFSILQASRMRSIKTEFISCPSCGRTLFDLQEVTAKVREKTDHLPGVKIAVMGCIVNGPGEMADAHFGYVGSKAGMIDLYVGKECVQKNIPSEEAVDRLVTLIKSHGLWIEKALQTGM